MPSEGNSESSSRFTLLVLGVDEWTEVAGVIAISGVDSREFRVPFEGVDLAVEEGLW